MKGLKVFTLVFLLLIIACQSTQENQAAKGDPPKRVILFISDAMPVAAPERIPLPAMQQLIQQGCYYEHMHVNLAAHPDRNDDTTDPAYYPWGCSLPNPVAMTGTLFIGLPDVKQHMIQHSFTQRPAAFTVNCDSYEEISPGYTLYHQLEENGFWDLFKDEMPVQDAKQIIENLDPAFLRIHLQGPGSAGWIVYMGTESYSDAHLKYADPDGSLPWFRNIWHPQSPYVHQALYADSLLGEFVDWLKATDRWDDTVLMVMGDHGQADYGSHPAYEIKSSMTPFVIAGKGIKQGKRFDAAEIIDLVPTIAHISGVERPEYAMGRVLKESFVGESDGIESEQTLAKLNQVLIRHHQLLQEHPDFLNHQAFQRVNETMLTIEKIGSWHQHVTDLESLLEHNENILEQLEEIAASS